MSIELKEIIQKTSDSVKLLNQSSNDQEMLQIYKITINSVKNQKPSEDYQKNVYLNIRFSHEEEKIIQTPCVQIINENRYFEISTKMGISKIEVLDYDSMKKLCKISLKGIDKVFKYTHLEEKNQIKVTIERAHSKIIQLKKRAKLVQSVLIQKKSDNSESSSTGDSSSQFSS